MIVNSISCRKVDKFGKISVIRRVLLDDFITARENHNLPKVSIEFVAVKISISLP